MLRVAALIFSVLAVASADVEVTLFGHRVVFIETLMSYSAAEQTCQQRGARLLTLCNGDDVMELRDVLGNSFGGRHVEAWIGFKTSKVNYRFPQVELADELTGDNCRIFSSYQFSSRSWNVYAKPCNSGNRYVMCEYDEPMNGCPGNELVVEPEVMEPEVMEPEVKEPEVMEPEVMEPEVLVEPEVINAPEILVEPTEPEVAVEPTEPEQEECMKERKRFSGNGLDVEVAFQAGSCLYAAKQCNAEMCYCVNPKNGKRSFGNMEVPLGESYDCTQKLKSKCLIKRFSARLNGKMAPACSANGKYAPKQCSESECWCVKTKNGKEVKKTRTSDKDSLSC